MASQLTVKAENYVSHFDFIESDFFRFDRIHRIKSPSSQLEAYPSFWTLSIGSPEPGVLKVPTSAGLYPIEGPHMVFTPPYAPVEWRLAPGVLEFSAFVGTSPLPHNISTFPLIIKGSIDKLPSRKMELLELLRSIQSSGVTITPPGLLTQAAERVKQAIDANFYKRISIKDIARDLNYSTSFIARSFKSTYGLTPIEYRTRLRLFDAQMNLIKRSSKINSIAFASGYSDPGHFFRQFREFFRARPSQFRAPLSEATKDSTVV